MDKLTINQIENILIEQIAMITATKKDKINSQDQIHSFGIDSLGFIELLVFIEKQFNLKLMESGLTKEDFKTVAALSKCIAKLLPNE